MFEKNENLTFELVTRSYFFLFFNLESATGKQKHESLTIELVTRTKIKFFSTSN